jgi:hypothetical protein
MLIASRFVTVDFICTFDMHWYPFDVQECEAIIDLRSKDVHFINLVEGKVDYSGPQYLLQYTVQEVVFVTATVKRLKILLVLTREPYNRFGNSLWELALGTCFGNLLW